MAAAAGSLRLLRPLHAATAGLPQVLVLLGLETDAPRPRPCLSFPSARLSLEESEEERKPLLYAQLRSHWPREHAAVRDPRGQLSAVSGPGVGARREGPRTCRPAAPGSEGADARPPAAWPCPTELTSCCRGTSRS